MSLDLWNFSRLSGQGTEQVENVPYYQDGALVYEPEIESSSGGVIYSQAACGMHAHWNALRMRPKTTGYAGHLKLGQVTGEGLLLALQGNALEHFTISITETDVIIEVSVNGGLINRAFPDESLTLDLRWSVGPTDTAFICNGEEITAGGITHGTVLSQARFGEVSCHIRQAYLIDNALTIEQLRART